MPFQKGVSGNPKGRPKDSPQLQEIKALCQQHAPLAIKRAVDILKNKKAKYGDWLKAGDMILDRAYGKPLQEVKGVAFNRYTQIWTSAIDRLQDVDAEGRVVLKRVRAEVVRIEDSRDKSSA